MSGADARVAQRCRQTLKRVANEKKNTKAAGRALAKIAHANPGAVFGVILTQVEAYDNLIAPIVDCLGCLGAGRLKPPAQLAAAQLYHWNGPNKPFPTAKGKRAHAELFEPYAGKGAQCKPGGG